jgi:hypothetical protein
MNKNKIDYLEMIGNMKFGSKSESIKNFGEFELLPTTKELYDFLQVFTPRFFQ